MKRPVFAIFWIGSLLLAILASVFWVRGYWKIDSVLVQRWHQYVLESSSGCVTFARISVVYEPPTGAGRSRFLRRGSGPARFFQ